MADTELNLVDAEFENPDNTEVTTDEPQKQYTMIDHLDEDPPIQGQTWVCVSFVSPEGIMNCSVRGLKVRGVYATEQEARNAAKKLQSMDKYFHVFVGEVGKWLPWDPDPNSTKESEYDDPKLNKLMQAQQNKQNEILNNLVGKKKEQVDTDTKAHKRRVAESIKKGAVEPSKEISAPPETKHVPRPPQNRDGTAIRDRMRKTLQARRNANPTEDFKVREELVQKETERLRQNNQIVNDSTDKIKNINSNISKMQEYLKNYRAKKADNSENKN